MTRTRLTQLVCPECGTIFPMMRKVGKQKDVSHRKWLYCYVCKKETNHVEGRDLDSIIARAGIIGEENLSRKEKEVYQYIKKR